MTDLLEAFGLEESGHHLTEQVIQFPPALRRQTCPAQD
jgi:hypothetical protein